MWSGHRFRMLVIRRCVRLPAAKSCVSARSPSSSQCRSCAGCPSSSLQSCLCARESSRRPLPNPEGVMLKYLVHCGENVAPERNELAALWTQPQLAVPRHPLLPIPTCVASRVPASITIARGLVHLPPSMRKHRCTLEASKLLDVHQ